MPRSAASFNSRGLSRQGRQLLGGPDWIGNERFDITAKPESAVAPADAMLMLQTLLADRFQLKVHNETRELPEYALITGPTDPKLKPATEANCCGGSKVSARGQLSSKNVTLSQFAGTLSEVLGRPVVDETGLQERFDIELRWRPDASEFGGHGRPNADDLDAPSIFTALQEQLGLKLKSRKGTVEVLIIDHAERPSENSTLP